MPTRLRGLERGLDAPSLVAVAYGEIGSSLYFALGIVALYALGLTPWVLLAVGIVFVVVSLSYAEGTAAMPETGGAAAFVRRAFNDPAGFVTGWVLFLDYLIVMALAALFVPHYFGEAVEWDGITHGPWDGILGICTVALIAVVRLVRRTQLYRIAVALAGIALTTQLLIVVLGLALVVSAGDLGEGVDLGTAPSWGSIAFALALATLAFTGLETVANLAAEVREPGRALPRSLFGAIAAVVVVTTLVAIVGVGAYPAAPDPSAPDEVGTELGGEWGRAPLVGIVVAFDEALPAAAVDVLRVLVGATGVIVLLAAISTSISGAGRLAYALARREMLPHAFARLSRRTLIAPVSIASAALLAAGLLLIAVVEGEPARFLASLYSFGILLAFTAAQLAVLRLRVTEPELPRPFRVPIDVRLGRVVLPLPALFGAGLTAALWILALATHHAALVGGPIWLALGAAVYVLSRRLGRQSLLGRVEPTEADLVPTAEGEYERILVPLKLSDIGEEVLATALKLGQEHGARVEAVHVIRVPMDRPLGGPLEVEEARRALESIEEARELGAELGVEVESEVIRARSIGEAIVEKAREDNVDLVLLGSAPRWRRQSRFFSPTVDHVLRYAPCQVMVVAYPEGVLEDGATVSE
jgi:APA family basic amino acid/polyamine antiporter